MDSESMGMAEIIIKILVIIAGKILGFFAAIGIGAVVFRWIDKKRGITY